VEHLDLHAWISSAGNMARFFRWCAIGGNGQTTLASARMRICLQCAGTDVNSVCRARIGAPVNQSNPGAHDTATFPFKARPAYKHESADSVAGAGVIVTADDFSLVKLFSYPVIADDAPFRAYRGHASHVTCVRFSSDDRTLFSVGGIDRCIFQWKTVGINLEDQAQDDFILKALEEAAFHKHQVWPWANSRCTFYVASNT
jgi:hypothetical protein